MFFGSIFIFLFCKVLSQSPTVPSCEPVGLGEKCSISCSKCLPGLACNDKNICEIEKGTCNSFKWTDSLWKPSCDEDGTFSAVQCKGEKSYGRCFCFSKTGKRMYGWAWWKTRKNMTCACSRHVQRLADAGRTDVTLHCTQDGNYEELQCDNGLCWCVEPKTGAPTQRVYPESLIEYLPCYKNMDLGSMYLRQCESKSLAQEELLKKLKIHGRKFTHLDGVFCDNDGRYGRYKIIQNIVRCSWTDGKQMGNYEATVGNILDVNCNCARDSRIFSEVDSLFEYVCKANGNYDQLQSSNGYLYCVDQDGFPTTELGKFGEIPKCPKT